MSKLNEYKELLSKNYDEAVEFLLEKYGQAPDDYYREASYIRFLNNEIKTITKGKYSRTSEGLYCHHIDEDKYLNLSDKIFIRQYRYPFEFQKKDRLVYCDLFEHAILHVLIAKESNLQFGFPGLETKILPMIRDWFVGKKIPSREWMKNCYDTAYLEPEDALEILDLMCKALDYPRELRAYY